MSTCKSDGFVHVCTKWRNAEGWQGSGRLAREVYAKEKAKIDDQLCVSIGLKIITPEAPVEGDGLVSPRHGDLVTPSEWLYGIESDIHNL